MFYAAVVNFLQANAFLNGVTFFFVKLSPVKL